MAEKTIKTRIQSKHETEANWNQATNFVPLKGEIIIYDPDTTYDYPRIKVGDGKTNVISLKFVTEGVAKQITDGLAGKLSTSGKAADSDKLDGFDSSYFAVAETVNATLATKANSADVYKKTETNTQISNAINALDVSAPSASGTTTSFIDSVSQTNGKISATKKTITSASTSAAGIVKLNDAVNSTSTTTAATANAVKKAYDAATSAAADAASRSPSTHGHGNITNAGALATANAVVVTDGNKKVVASTSITTTELGYLDGVTSSVQNQLNAKANKTDIATTVMQGTATQATTYWKIADFGNWGTGNWMQKGFSMLISSRAGEMVWVSLAANDSNTSASAFRLINRYSKIAALHYSVAESAIYVTAAGWSNNICAHVLSNVNGDYVPTIAQATALPSDAVAINITEFGVADANTRVGAVNIDATGNMTVPGTVTVENKVKLDYDSTNECLNFVFV